MSDSSGYGSNGSNGTNGSNGSNGTNGSNGSNSSNGANAENHADMGSNISSSLNGGSLLAGSVAPSVTSLPSHATCSSAAGSGSVAQGNDAAQTNHAADAMQVDAEPDSGMGSSLTRTPLNSARSSLSGDTITVAASSRASVGGNNSTASAPMSAANLTLYNSVLADIRSGLLQLPPDSAAPGNLEADLRVRANLLLQQNLTARGLAPSGQTLGELRRTVDTFCRLAGWLQSEETLENATIEIDYRMHNGSVEKIRCQAADNVKNLQEAISARFGASSAGTRQLLCNGEPMTDQTQCLYQFVARRGQGMRNAGALTVQEVVRVNSG